jgi:hypothetical protein
LITAGKSVSATERAASVAGVKTYKITGLIKLQADEDRQQQVCLNVMEERWLSAVLRRRVRAGGADAFAHHLREIKEMRALPFYGQRPPS